ncbi:MAG: sporulation transcription factor Spo0A [Clostridia bacterium]|nr:sporulation transcription factor Spo0A [Clostridia bacterium]
MKDEISVLITDDNVEFGDLLKEKFSQEYDMHVVGVARDGVQAIEMIRASMPDIVVLDIIMPNLDGIGVLEKISELKLEKKPTFIMLSAIGQDLFIQKAIVLGAEYYIVKPFDVDLLISRVRQAYKEKVRDYRKRVTSPVVKPPRMAFDLEVEVTNMMREVGIPAHMSGYQYIREAIIQAVNNEDVFSSITKVLYPAVAKKFNTTPQKVERAIRNAIENAWTRGNPDSIDSLFGYASNFNKGKPTNSEFIAMMSDKMRLSMKRH